MPDCCQEIKKKKKKLWKSSLRRKTVKEIYLTDPQIVWLTENQPTKQPFVILTSTRVLGCTHTHLLFSPPTQQELYKQWVFLLAWLIGRACVKLLLHSNHIHGIWEIIILSPFFKFYFLSSFLFLIFLLKLFDYIYMYQNKTKYRQEFE